MTHWLLFLYLLNALTWNILKFQSNTHKINLKGAGLGGAGFGGAGGFGSGNFGGI